MAPFARGTSDADVGFQSSRSLWERMEEKEIEEHKDVLLCKWNANKIVVVVVVVSLWYTFIAVKGICLFFPLYTLGEINVGVTVYL